ncbi:MAG: hypothetical protein AAF441_20315 [Pseudomonadota bacterium]
MADAVTDPFGVKKSQKEQKKRLDEQQVEADAQKEDEIKERVARSTQQLFRNFGRGGALGGGLGRPGILG